MFRGVHSNYIIVVHGASHIYMELNPKAAVGIVCGNSLKQTFKYIIKMEEQIGAQMVHHVVKNLTNVAIVDCKVQLTTHNLTKVNWPVAYPYFTDRTLADAKKLCPFLDSVCLAENRDTHSKKEWPYAIQATFTMPDTNTSVEAIVKFAESCEYIADRIILVLVTWPYIIQESKDVMKKFSHANR